MNIDNLQMVRSYYAYRNNRAEGESWITLYHCNDFTINIKAKEIDRLLIALFCFGCSFVVGHTLATILLLISMTSLSLSFIADGYGNRLNNFKNTIRQLFFIS